MSDDSDYQIPTESSSSSPFRSLLDTYQNELKQTKKQALQVPASIQKLMGEANNCFMFKQEEQAKAILQEIIRQCPNYTEPYHLLGTHLMRGLNVRAHRGAEGRAAEGRAFLHHRRGNEPGRRRLVAEDRLPVLGKQVLGPGPVLFRQVPEEGPAQLLGPGSPR